MSSDASFLVSRLRVVDKPVHRLGLSFNFGIDEAGVDEAVERGINYLFWTTAKTGRALPAVRRALRRDRERIVLAAGPSFAFFGGNVRRGTERLLRKLGVDHIDVLHLFWLGKMSAWTDDTVDALQRLREEEKVRAVGASIHDRTRAGRLAREASALDLLMVRYNAAHPGAEKDIFPHLALRRPNVVAYTATRWRKLLTAPRGWTGPVMTAGDCYRFCLSNEDVDVVLTGPSDAAQLRANLAAVEEGGSLTEEEMGWMRRFGRAVHG